MDGKITLEFAGLYQEGKFVAHGIGVNLFDAKGETVSGFCVALPSGLPSDMQDLYTMLLPFVTHYVRELTEELLEAEEAMA